jgi:hypothetical protein
MSIEPCSGVVAGDTCVSEQVGRANKYYVYGGTHDFSLALETADKSPSPDQGIR